MADDLVLTPGGYRARERVHHIEPDHCVDQTNGHARKYHRSGGMVRDYGPIEPKPPGMPLMPRNVQHSPGVAAAAAFGSGWIVYSGWTKPAARPPISRFVTTWVVPAEPITKNGQTLFLFNGIQNATMIYQPVLQWGPSAAGGGPFWAIASWYADGQDGHSFYSTLTQVNPGAVLVGMMELTGQSPAGFSYRSSFQDHANSLLPIQNVPELTWCNETLEAYSITAATDYPASRKTAMKSIEVRLGDDEAPLSWTAFNEVTDTGQKCVVVRDGTPNGEVDLCYR